MKYPCNLMWIWRDNAWKLAYEVGGTWQEVQIQPSGAPVPATSTIAGPVCAVLAAPPSTPPMYVEPPVVSAAAAPEAAASPLRAK